MEDRTYALEHKDIKKLLIELSIPAIIAMMANGLYNLIDTIFIGKGVDSLAIGGLSVVYPVEMILMAFCMLVGVGSASIISRSLGEKDFVKANVTAANAFVLTLVWIGILITIIFLYIKPILLMMGATRVIMPFAEEYLKIILIGSLFLSITTVAGYIIRAEGNTRIVMFATTAGIILNIVLDGVFIFIFNLGIAGAAYATVIAQIFSFIIVVRYLISTKTIFRFRKKYTCLNKSIVKEILYIGFAPFLKFISASLIAVVLNNSLKFYGGDYAITVFGINQKLSMFLFLPISGIVQAMQPIVGYNYGAERLDRVKETVKYAAIFTTLWGTVGWALFEIVPGLLLLLFTDNYEIIKVGISSLRIINAFIFVVGIQTLGVAYFQAVGEAFTSLILSFLRQIILVIPLVLILPKVLHLRLLGIWIAYPIADVISAVFTVWFIYRSVRKFNLKENSLTY